MKRCALFLAALFASAAIASAAQPRRVALVVQDHTSGKAKPPVTALADTLTARLTGEALRLVVPANSLGTKQNRTPEGEEPPAVSAAELGRILGADGVLTAAVQEFTCTAVGSPAIAYAVRTRLALSLVDCATGESVCAVSAPHYSRNYTAEQMQEDAAALFEAHLHAAAEAAAARFLAAYAKSAWAPAVPKTITVFFGCNVLGADIQIDGLARGTCPAQLSLTPGIHTILVSYPPYYLDYRRQALLDTDGQTYAVVLQITPEGERQRRSGELFEKQKTLIDAELARYQNVGEVEDFVRKTIADGTALYWKNSCSRIVITDGIAENIDFATPKVDGGVLQRGPSSDEIGARLHQLLETNPE